jgi:hypothetical protein
MSSNDATQGQFVERPESLLSPETAMVFKAGRPPLQREVRRARGNWPASLSKRAP